MGAEWTYVKPTRAADYDSTYNPPEIDYSAGEILNSAWQQENSFTNLYIWAGKENYKPDLEYNPYEDPANRGYEDYEDMADVQSVEAARNLRARIDVEHDNKKKLASAGWGGVTAMIAAGVAGPESLVPFMGPAARITKGAAIAEGAAIGGLTIGAIEAGREAMFHQTQVTRTLDESIANTVGATVIGGILGAGVGGFAHHSQYLQAAQDFNRVLTGEAEILAESGSAGAMKTGMTFEEAELTGSAGASEVHGAAKMSPSAWFAQSSTRSGREMGAKLAEDDFLRQGNLEGTATEASAETTHKLAQAEFADVVEHANTQFKKYKKAGGKMTRRQFNEEVTNAWRNGDVHPVPEVQAVAQNSRKLVEKRTKEAVELGMLDPRYLDKAKYGNYVHRIWNKGYIKANRQVLKNILVKYFTKAEGSRLYKDPDYNKLDDLEIEDLSDQIINHVVYGDDVEGLAGIHKGEFSETVASPLHARTLNVPDELVKDFLEGDFETVLQRYNRQMSADIALKRTFGDTSLKDTWSQVAREYGHMINKANEAGDVKTAKKLTKEMEQAREYGTGLRDRLRGTYGMPDNAENVFYRAGRALRALNYLRLLGGVTISSIPDLGGIVVKNGMGNTLMHLSKVLKHVGLDQATKKEMRAAAVGLDMVLSGRAKAMADLMDPFTGHTAVERGLSYGEETFSKLTLIDQWNTALKQFTGSMVQHNMIEAIHKSAAGTIKSSDAARLAKSGIDEETAKRMSAEINKYGESRDMNLSGADMWDEPDLATVFRAGILKSVDSTIVTPGIGDTPLWMSQPLGKFVGQFKTFTFAVINRMTIPAAQQARRGDVAVLNGTALMLALGYSAYALKSAISGRETSDDPNVIAWESLDRSGLMGVYMEGVNIAGKATGIGGTSRYASRSVAGALVGPTSGFIGDVASVSYDAAQGEMDTDTAVKAVKLVPYNNLFYLRGLFEKFYNDK